MNPLPIATHLRFQDVLHILFLELIAYHLYPSCGVHIQRETMTRTSNRPARELGLVPLEVGIFQVLQHHSLGVKK